jgi:hypothetical protein
MSGLCTRTGLLMLTNHCGIKLQRISQPIIGSHVPTPSRTYVPKQLSVWGKMKQTGGGDVIHARDLVSGYQTSPEVFRDATFVKVSDLHISECLFLSGIVSHSIPWRLIEISTTETCRLSWSLKFSSGKSANSLHCMSRPISLRDEVRVRKNRLNQLGHAQLFSRPSTKSSLPTRTSLGCRTSMQTRRIWGQRPKLLM